MRYPLTLLASLLFCINCIAAEETDCGGIEHLIECPQPSYPSRTELREGYVLLSYKVAADGSTQNIEILESSPSGMWDSAAIEALSKWRFVPLSEPPEAVLKTRFTFDFH